MGLLDGVSNDAAVTNNKAATEEQIRETQKEEKINSAFTAETEQQTNNEAVSVFNSKKDDVEVNVQAENTENKKGEKDKGQTKQDLVRPVSQYEINMYLRDPRNGDSGIYQRKLEELNKLNSKSNRTGLENIRIQNLKNDIKNIKQRVSFKIKAGEKENTDVYENNNAKKMFNIELVNVTDAQKIKANVNNTDSDKAKEDNGTESTKATNDIDNTIGVRVYGMYSKNGSTVSGDVTLGNDYILNGFVEHIKKNSTFGAGGSAQIRRNSEIDASLHAYYIYTKGSTEFSAKGDYNVFSANIDGKREDFHQGDVSLNLDTPNFGAQALAEFTELGNSYSLNARGSYSREWKNGITFDGTANAGYSYLDNVNAHSADFGLNAKVSYKADDIHGYVAIDASGNYTKSKTFDLEDYNTSTSVDLGVSAKNFDFNTNVIYENGSDASELQCGAGLGYTFEKLGGTKVEVDYNQTIGLTGTDTENFLAHPKHKIDVKVKAPLGQIIYNNRKLRQAQNNAKAEAAASPL